MLDVHRLFWKTLQIPTRFLVWILFDLRVYGRRHVPRAGGALIVSNHQSNLDPVLIAVDLRRPLNYIAKSELFHHRFAAWLLRWLNAFPVRQGKGDIGAVKETIHRLQEGGLLNLFPEGGRTPDGTIQPLLKGVALIVRKANVPVIPAAIVGAFEAWPIHKRYLRPWPIRVRFGPPLDLAGLETDEEITAAIDRALRRMFAQLKRRGVSEPLQQEAPDAMTAPVCVMPRDAYVRNG